MSSEITNAVVPPIIEQRRGECIFFDEGRIPRPTNIYVCWIDVMGSRSIMLRSLGIASNFIMKLHVAALRVSEQFWNVSLYPMIDGIYICSTSQHPLLGFINKLYSRLAITFIQETKPLHRFLVRSGLAFGPVVRGRDTLNCAYELRRHPRHAEQILLGPTLAQAYQTEGDSAPFGVALHESARTFSPYGENVMSGTYWQWWKNHSREGDDELARKLYDSLVEHYKWCSENTNGLSYKKEDIDRHRLLAKEYFSN